MPAYIRPGPLAALPHAVLCLCCRADHLAALTLALEVLSSQTFSVLLTMLLPKAETALPSNSEALVQALGVSPLLLQTELKTPDPSCCVQPA